jgi:hypothetical protein
MSSLPTNVLVDPPFSLRCTGVGDDRSTRLGTTPRSVPGFPDLFVGSCNGAPLVHAGQLLRTLKRFCDHDRVLRHIGFVTNTIFVAICCLNQSMVGRLVFIDADTPNSQPPVFDDACVAAAGFDDSRGVPVPYQDRDRRPLRRCFRFGHHAHRGARHIQLTPIASVPANGR